MTLCDLYVLDKHNGRIHKIGTEQHDGLWVSNKGYIVYHNLQNGDGGTAKDDPEDGYVILETDFGMLETEYGICDKRYEKEIEEYLRGKK